MGQKLAGPPGDLGRCRKQGVHRVHDPINPGAVATAPMHLGQHWRGDHHDVALAPRPLERRPGHAVSMRECEDPAGVEDEAPRPG